MSDQLATRPQTAMQKVTNYIMSPEVKERFTDMMGPNGIYYLNQVLILVANSDDLQKCSPKSILISAMRAASLKLSLDPSQGQAWIIPYKGEATYQTGYKGVYELAMRTNLYRFINVIDIYEGEVLIENRMTGNHAIGGKRTGDSVIARMLYFQLFNGFEKTFVMTIDEIDTHAKHYSRAINSPKSKWNDPVERPKMERKTVLVNGLRKWGRFNQNDLDTLNQIEQEQGWIDRDDYPDDLVEAGDQPRRDPETIKSELGIEADPVTGEVIPVPPMPEEPPAEKPTSQQDIEDRLVADKKFQNVFEAKNALKRIKAIGLTDEQKYEWAINYRAWRDINSTPDQAAKLANEGKRPS